jgi:hypothetical protein
MKKLITILFFLFSTIAHAQIVKGRILDKEDMESIQGVTIELVGTDKKVISNKKGNFVLTINNNTSRLQISA